MINVQTIAKRLELEFERIHREQMQGIPILNTAISIQALGFHDYQGRILGVLITPWLMNVVMLPRADEDWSGMKLGQKQAHQFPARTYKFMVNEINDIGFCQTHSLYSPMHDFSSHEQALSVAQAFLDALMVEKYPAEEPLVDEELLGKVMRGEVTPETHFEDFATINKNQSSARPDEALAEKNISRRDLLHGKIRPAQNTA